MKITLNTISSRSDAAKRFARWGEAPALAFHQGMEDYAVTPLTGLPGLAQRLGVSTIWVKDESKRFGLNAFKGLGCSYAMAAYLCKRADIPIDRGAFSHLRSADVQSRLGQCTFITATDGNHGRAVAWAAKRMGHRAVIYMPEGTVQERYDNIAALGADVRILNLNYDDAVRAAADAAEKNGWILVQDTAWSGYESVPRLIMEGYTTLAREVEEQLAARHAPKPTHLLLQAGVGSMAGAIAAYFAARWGEDCPRIIIVEPDRADCFFRTAMAGDGHIHSVSGKLDSIMAGLCCGEPNPLSWDILKHIAEAFLSCEDYCAEKGMRILGRPECGDEAIVSGESGAATAGAFAELMENPAHASTRSALGIDAASRILLISTEGATDRQNYKRIVGE